MSFKPLEKAEIQLFQALQEFPPPAQQSPAIIQRIAEILQTSPAPMQEISQLKARAWEVYVDSHSEIHIHNTYNISQSFNQDCWNDRSDRSVFNQDCWNDRSDRSDRSTHTTTNCEIDWMRGCLFALIGGGAALLLMQQAYLDGIRDQMLRQELRHAP